MLWHDMTWHHVTSRHITSCHMMQYHIIWYNTVLLSSVAWFHVYRWKFTTHSSRSGNSLQWRHDRRDGFSNQQPHDCLLNHLFRRRSKKTLKLRVTGLCAGNSPVTGEFPAQIASDAEIFFNLMTSSRLILWNYIISHKVMSKSVHWVKQQWFQGRSHYDDFHVMWQ